MKNSTNSGSRGAAQSLVRFLGMATDSPSPARTLAMLRALNLTYTTAAVVIYTLPVDLTRQLVVFGEPESISYEWAICDGYTITEHSNLGYGCSKIALRDGLIAYYGAADLPTSCDDALALAARHVSRNLRFNNRPGSTERQSTLGLFLAAWQTAMCDDFPKTAAILETLVFGAPSNRAYGTSEEMRLPKRNG